MNARRGPSLLLYTIPIMLGLFGVFFAGHLNDSPIFQVILLLVSVAGPLLVAGMLVTRISATFEQRVALIVGVILLAVGATVTVWGLSENFMLMAALPQRTITVSRWTGLGALVLGILAILFIVARRDEEVGEIAARFRYLADHMSEGFILTASDGTITLVNDALTHMTGLKADDLIGKDGAQLARAFELEPMLKQIDNRRQGIASEYRIAWKRDGIERQLWISGTPIFDKRGRFAGALATVRDITEQFQMSKRLERYAHGLQQLVEDRTEKLYQSRQRLRDLLVHMNEGFVTIDGAYHIRFANARFCELLHVGMEEIIGRDLVEYVEPAARGRFLEILEAAAERGSVRPQQELTLVCRDGISVPVTLSIAPIAARPDEDASFSLVVTDIREMLRMQQQLEQRAAELEEANAELRMLDRAKDGFLSTVSHELRTPLSTVRGYAEMLNAGTLGALEPPQLNALKVMLRNIERLGSLIDEIIEFSRMEVRGIEIHQTLLRTGRLLQECAAAIQPQILARGLELLLTTPEDDCVAWGDRKRLAQLLAILMSNSVKFCERGGRITLRGEHRDDGTLIIAVSDTGIGIEPSIQKRVFDKFFQADSSLSRRYEGAGIGLSIAKTIAEAHGGRIDLESRPGEGSTFTLTLPGACFIPPSTKREAFPPGTRVLIVAAENEFSSSLASLLGDCGIDVGIATSGLAGLRAAKEDHPDLIIIDDVMPDLGGRAALSRYREELDLAAIPVILMQDNRRTDHGADNLHMDDAAVLVKPFLASDLLGFVHAVIAHPKGTIAAQQSAQTRFGSSTVLAVGEDADLLEWVTTVLRIRKIKCICAPTVMQAQELLQGAAPRAIVADVDCHETTRQSFVESVRDYASAAAVNVLFLTGLPSDDEGKAGNGVRVLRKPFSAKELYEALSLRGGAMA